MTIPKITTPLIITVVTAALVFVAIIVLFRRCQPIPKDDSQAKIDTILKQQAAREDSLSKQIDSLNRVTEYHQAISDSFYVIASNAQDRAAKYYASYKSARERYDRLLTDTPKAVPGECSEVLQYADSVIQSQSVALVKKDSVIGHQKLIVKSLFDQVQAQKQSAAGFRSDFMKLNTQVVQPLQIQLKEERRQHAQNRFWKKFFAGTTAALGSKALFDLIKK